MMELSGTDLAAYITTLITLFLAAATFYQARKTGETVREMREARLAQERPLIKISVDLSRPYMLFVIVKNVGVTPALDISFGFSEPLINPSFIHPERGDPGEEPKAVVLSEKVSYFAKGLNFLAPNEQVSVYWGVTDQILKNLKERGLTEKGIVVTVSYKSTGGHPFGPEEWTLNPSMHDELIWFMLTTPEMLMDKAANLADKLDRSMHYRGYLKVQTTEKRRHRRWESLLGWSRQERWKKMLLIRLRSWREQFWEK